MNKLYTIGETAKLLGVSPRTLRYYDEINLIKPTYIDEDTGYRYYTFEKFHYIDRIKYLQSFDMDLDEIKSIIKSEGVESLVNSLNEKLLEKEKEIENLQKIIKDIKWYSDYWTYINNESDMLHSYRITLPERYMLKISCREDWINWIHAPEVKMQEKKAELKQMNIKYRRQYGYVFEYKDFIENKFLPTDYFIFISEKLEGANFEVLPAGDYLCIVGRALQEEWNPNLISEFFKNKEEPKFCLALEFEDNLDDFKEANYEFQFFMG
ncbi:helix-turn-helix domain-containing protein [Fusobacterium ulcerans]|uniref:MerR family transcriptional regulator n=1 Tax=Fusobacterium ulcerans TaxID=861 RepID=UPI002E773146|nr:helix-turn-helix domain-containing protein [Fusobacterium ulcerans]MEE0138823.1 helix-turn-helix domain-containing protein [Fusobacterium ulcerans]